MKKFCIVFLFLITLTQTTLAEEKTIAMIEAINWTTVFKNINGFLESEGKDKYFWRYIETIEFFASEFGVISLMTIANVESGFQHVIGEIDENDLTHFQININQISLQSLAKICNKEEITIDDLHNNAAYYAAHVWVLNMFERCIRMEKDKTLKMDNLCDAMTAYHHPYKLSKSYWNKIYNAFGSSYIGRTCKDITIEFCTEHLL